MDEEHLPKLMQNTVRKLNMKGHGHRALEVMGHLLDQGGR